MIYIIKKIIRMDYFGFIPPFPRTLLPRWVSITIKFPFQNSELKYLYITFTKNPGSFNLLLILIFI